MKRNAGPRRAQFPGEKPAAAESTARYVSLCPVCLWCIACRTGRPYQRETSPVDQLALHALLAGYIADRTHVTEFIVMNGLPCPVFFAVLRPVWTEWP